MSEETPMACYVGVFILGLLGAITAGLLGGILGAMIGYLIGRSVEPDDKEELP